MDSGKRQYLQDIYATDRADKDEFTPQVSSEVLEERKREIRKHQLTSFFLGMLVLLLSVSLVIVVIREYIQIQQTETSMQILPQEYIPRHSLKAESQWVLDFSSDYGNPEWDGTGKRPFSAEWVQKAAWNLIMAQQAASVEKNEMAAMYYEQALEILPDIEGVKVPLGALYFKMEQFDKALALLENVPKETLTPDVLNNLGVACITAKAYDQAEFYLREALKKRPTYAEPFKNLATLYKEMERENDAIDAYEQYIDLRPADLDAQHSFALYLTKLGRWEQASVLLNRLTREITDVPVLYFLLARVEMQNQHPEKALAALQRSIQLSDPGAAIAYMNSKEFDQLRASDEFQNMMSSLEKSDR